MASHGGSPYSVRANKNKSREAAYMYRDGYLASKAYQRRQLRMEKMRLERSQRRSPEVRQMAWGSYRTAKLCSEPGLVRRNPGDEFPCDIEDPLEEAGSEAVAWSLLQYEQLVKDESELPHYPDEETAVWCPLCEKGLLVCPDSSCFVCSWCGATLPRRDGESLEHLETKIFQALDEHELQCRNQPQFLITPAELGDVSLILVCDGCCMSCDISGSDLTR